PPPLLSFPTRRSSDLIAAFIPNRPLLGKFLGARAAAMIGLYVLGFVAAVATAWLLKSSVLKSARTPFILEMPPYRWPTMRGLARSEEHTSELQSHLNL